MSVLDAGGKQENPEKTLQKQVWTGNQMHVQSDGTGDQTRAQWCTAPGVGENATPPACMGKP